MVPPVSLLARVSFSLRPRKRDGHRDPSTPVHTMKLPRVPTYSFDIKEVPDSPEGSKDGGNANVVRVEASLGCSCAGFRAKASSFAASQCLDPLGAPFRDSVLAASRGCYIPSPSPLPSPLSSPPFFFASLSVLRSILNRKGRRVGCRTDKGFLFFFRTTHARPNEYSGKKKGRPAFWHST